MTPEQREKCKGKFGHKTWWKKWEDETTLDFEDEDKRHEI